MAEWLGGVRQPAVASGAMSWQDLFWENADRRGAPGRMQATAVAQQGVFDWLAPTVPQAGARERAKPSTGGASSVRPAAVTTARPEVARADGGLSGAARRLRVVRRSSALYAERRGRIAREEIARLLEVTRGVDGIEEARRFELPSGSFVPQLQLWRGRPIGTPFVSRCGRGGG